MDFPSRLIHGNLPHVLNNLVQTDYPAFGRNITKVASALQSLFDSAKDDGMLQVARYSLLMQSVAKKVGLLKPAWTPGPIPRPHDDEGIVNVFSYLTEWIQLQLDKPEIQSLGQSCTSFLDSALNVDWSDTYRWNLGRMYSSWNINSWKNTMADIYGYCNLIARMDPRSEGEADSDVPMPPPTVPPAAATTAPDGHININVGASPAKPTQRFRRAPMPTA